MVKKRIAIVGNSSDTLIRFRLELLKVLVEENEVYTFCPSYSNDDLETLQGLGVHPYKTSFSRFGINPFFEFIGILRLAYDFYKLRVDTVFGYFMKPALYSILAAKLSRRKRSVVLLEGLGYFFTTKHITVKSQLISSVLNLLIKRTLPNADVVMFLNNDDINLICSLIPRKFNHVLVGGIGVDLQYYSYQPIKASSQLNFLMVARILREKGVFEFIEAARTISIQYPSAQFWLVGGLDQNPGGIPEDDLKHLVANTNITWLGEQGDVRDFLVKCHVFVLPSYREGVPRSTQEAMAVGRAVITTDVPGCKDTVVDGSNGVLVKVKSASELARAFKTFLDQPELIEKYGSKSRELAEERYDARQKSVLMSSYILDK